MDCQVRDCDMPAAPWALVVVLDELEVELLLCAEHEAAYTGARERRVDEWLGLLHGDRP